MSDEAALEGGCHCGGLRFRVTGPTSESGYCHCRDCQPTSAAPVVARASYASSAQGAREFCPGCGSHVVFRDVAEPKSVHINSATLDKPDSVPPSHHIYTRSRISWFEIGDDLPRHDGTRNDSETPGLLG